MKRYRSAPDDDFGNDHTFQETISIDIDCPLEVDESTWILNDDDMSILEDGFSADGAWYSSDYPSLKITDSEFIADHLDDILSFDELKPGRYNLSCTLVLVFDCTVVTAYDDPDDPDDILSSDITLNTEDSYVDDLVVSAVNINSAEEITEQMYDTIYADES